MFKLRNLSKTRFSLISFTTTTCLVVYETFKLWYSKRGPVTDFSEVQNEEIRQQDIYRSYNNFNCKIELLKFLI